jgi:two-component system, OmpR family, sensor histidine kinase CiaH
MFRQARLKLTAWYILSIMLVSALFSLIIYQLLIGEVDRFERLQRSRIEHFLNGDDYYLGLGLPPPPSSIRLTNPDLITETRHRIIIMLVGINSGILVFASLLGYFLSGRTLRPIQAMVDEQNRFVSDASHELRTPITALKTSLEVSLRDPALDLSSARALISDSIVETNTLQSLVEQLLSLSKHNFTKTLNERPVDLALVLGQSIRTVSSLATQKHITISSRPGKYTVLGDSSQLVNLFTILLDNAIKYSPENEKITLRTSKVPGSVSVSVTDHGIGISKNQLPKIFDRFYRGDVSRARLTAGGFGLGLAIAKKIVSDHHGTISVKSKINIGSTFTVKLPLQ